MTRFFAALLLACIAPRGQAQEAAAPAGEQRTTLSGVIFDSLSRAPLHGALVQLVGAEAVAHGARTTTSDTLGRFEFAALSPGVYLLGFLHPLLDSLGLEPSVGEVRIVADPIAVQLAIPSAVGLRALACGPRAGEVSESAVLGIVRNAADGRPVADATVVAEWLEFQISRRGGARSTARISARTTAAGRFALCNVPRPGVIAVVARVPGDSTPPLEFEVPADGFLRRDLFVVARAADTGTPAAAGDKPGSSVDQAIQSRTGVLRGTVVTSPEGRPVADAHVWLEGGPRARTDGSGRWVLEAVPLGTRVLHVRAVGFYPDRIMIDIVPGAPALHTALPTMKSVLDTVRITAERAMNPRIEEFYQRSRSGLGRYLTPDDIARLAAVNVSDVLRQQPGLQIERGPRETAIRMRGIFADRCEPDIYVDGANMRTLAAEDLDGLIGPREVAGIEIYPPGTVPPQFQRALEECGSIVLWTRPLPGPQDRRSAGRRLLTLGGIAALSAGVALLLQ